MFDGLEDLLRSLFKAKAATKDKSPVVIQKADDPDGLSRTLGGMSPGGSDAAQALAELGKQ